MSVGTRSRNWIGTIPLERYGSKDHLESKLLESGAEKIIYQLELGEETHYAHWQVYVQWSGAKGLQAIRKAFPHCHWEIRKGTHQEAKDYCTKDDTRIDGPWVVGDKSSPNPGQRTDLAQFKEDIKTCSVGQLWENHFGLMLRYHRSVATVRAALTPDTVNMPRLVYVFWGLPDKGKSARAAVLADSMGLELYRVIAPATRGQPVWFDNYSGQGAALFDDFYGWIAWSRLLTLTDRYPTRVDFRGGTSDWKTKLVVFTSNKPPREWYPNVDDIRYAAFNRRITLEVEIKDIAQKIDGVPDLPFLTNNE